MITKTYLFRRAVRTETHDVEEFRAVDATSLTAAHKIAEVDNSWELVGSGERVAAFRHSRIRQPEQLAQANDLLEQGRRAVAMMNKIDRENTWLEHLQETELDKIVALGLDKKIDEGIGDTVVREIQPALRAKAWAAMTDDQLDEVLDGVAGTELRTARYVLELLLKP